MEAQDVRDGEYRLFDCDGREYPLRAEDDFSPVVVGEPLDLEPRLDLVNKAAARFLSAISASESPTGDPEANPNPCERLEMYAD